MFHNPRFKKFFSFYAPYKRLFAMDLVCSLVVAATALMLPLLARHITQDILGGAQPDPATAILMVGGAMLLLILVQTGCGLFYDYKGHAMGAMIERDMRAQLFDQYQRLPFRFFDNQKIGALMTRLTDDLLNLGELYHHGPEDLIIYLLEFIGALVVLFLSNFKLTLVVCAFLPPMILYSIVFNKRLSRAFRKSRERIAEVNAQAEENLSGIRVVKSFTGEQLERDKFARENQAYLQSRCDIYRSESYYYTGMERLFVQLITFSVVTFGGIWITRGQLDLPDLILFLMYVGYLTAPIPQLARIIPQYQQGITGFNRFMDIMEQRAEDADDSGAVRLERVKGDVEFRDVSFRYSEEREMVLDGISLAVPGGESVAIVGSSGVGKTTLCSLIPRFYEVTQGQVLLDGIDVRRIRLDSLRESIGVVQQDVYLFSGTVLENIRYGRPDATLDEVALAAKKANAHEFITRLPRGYDTQIGQRGIRLSGGQKQRLSIARVFLKDPRVLIFDEATSQLDSESERVVHESLAALSEGRTTFVIAHRLSTIRDARRILVLTESGIEQQGTHDELIALGGAYANLYNKAL